MDYERDSKQISDTIGHIIDALFVTNMLSSQKKVLLKVLSLVGDEGIEINIFQRIMQLESKDDLNECESIVEHFVCRENIIIDEDITKFSLVGLGMKNTSGVAAKVFKILSDNNIAVKLITTSEIRITCAISSLSKEVAIREIAKEFNI